MTGAPTPTADLADEHGDALEVCTLELRSFGARPHFAGAISTVRCLDDNVLVKAAVAEPGNGRVLVVDGGGSRSRALLGGNVASLAADSGWAGVVINGCVRDTAELAAIDLGIVALGTHPRASTKLGAGERDVPVTFGGVTFTPGAHLTRDSDGLVVTPA